MEILQALGGEDHPRHHLGPTRGMARAGELIQGRSSCEATHWMVASQLPGDVGADEGEAGAG